MYVEQHLRPEEEKFPIFVNPLHPNNTDLVTQPTLVFPESEAGLMDSDTQYRLCLEYPLGIYASHLLPVTARRELRSSKRRTTVGFSTIDFLPDTGGHVLLSAGLTCDHASLRAYYHEGLHSVATQGHFSLPDLDPFHFVVNDDTLCLKFDGTWHQYPQKKDITKGIQTKSGYRAHITYLDNRLHLLVGHIHQGVTKSISVALPCNVPFQEWHDDIEKSLFQTYITGLTEHAESFLMDTSSMQSPLTSVKRVACSAIGESLLKKLNQSFPIYGGVTGTTVT